MSGIEFISRESVGELVRAQAEIRGDRIAYMFEGENVTFADLDAASNVIANAFINAGLKPGDRVAWLAQNLGDLWRVVVGAAKCGVVLAPLNWRLAPAEINAILKDTEAKLFFAEDLFLEPLQALPDFDPPQTVSLDGGALDRFIGDASSSAPVFKPDPEEGVAQLYTSGTTGLPKGVVLTHRCFSEVAKVSAQANILSPSSEEEVFAHALPHFHIAGLGAGFLCFSRAMPMRQYRQFDPAAILKDAQSGPPVNTFLVPAMVMMVLETANAANLSLDRFVALSYGAAPMPLGLLNQAINAFSNASFMQLYGMTESTGGISLLAPEDHDTDKPEATSAGKPLPGVEIKVIDPATGDEAPQGETGEIIIKTPFVMKCYWNRPDATAEVLKDGWYYSGDAGRFDEKGYLYVVDRIKDMVISGGENIYPAEIENALSKHENVLETAIIGASDERWGEIVKAFVVTRDGSELELGEINDFLEDKLARFKLPRLAQTIEALPRNASGKVLKTELRKM